MALEKESEVRVSGDGLLQADIDLTDNPHLSQEEIKNVMENDPHCVCAFKSPSFGVKGIKQLNLTSNLTYRALM